MLKRISRLCGLATFGLAGFMAGSALLGAGPAGADTSHRSVLRITDADGYSISKTVTVGLNKSMLIELPRELRDVLVSNPEILDAVVQTSNRVHLIARKLGQANAFFFDENGERILTLEVNVERDTATLDELINRLVPGGNVKSEILNDTVILTGSVTHPGDASQATRLAARFVTTPGESDTTALEKVINLLKVDSKEQIMLKVTVAEMSREVVKRLGVNWNGTHVGNMSAGFQTSNSFPVSSGVGTDSTLFGLFGPSSNQGSCVSAFGGASNPLSVAGGAGGTAVNCLLQNVQAFERHGLLRTLAEPTLTAISGENANFLAGGEFPVPVSQKDGQITVEYKPFGVGLSFTPLVISEGRIGLKINTEVSELSSENSIQLGSLSIPGLKVRRATTTVELPSGGTLAIAGLINDDTRQNMDGVPGLKKLPILGSLFRSRDFQKKETELVVLVTPYVVNAVARSALARPDDGFMPASDPKANLLGQLNRVYGREQQMPDGGLKGDYGFIVE